MSYQYRPPHPDQGYGRSHQDFIPPSTPSHPHDWQAQQSLFMGVNTPTYHQPVSFSPHVPNTVSNLGANILSLQATIPTETFSPLSGRVMYSSSSYNYGNPGYFYDPLQFPVSTETQTSHTYVPHQEHYVNNTSTTQVHDPSPNIGMPPC
jgi:hypothetical protein